MSRPHRVAVIGIGNPFAGDDGAGPAVVRRLRDAWGKDPQVLLTELEGDLFGLADFLGRADRLILVDAAVGDRPGDVVRATGSPEGLAPSLHQVDVVAAMRTLEVLRVVDPFPPWELWGVTVALPLTLGEGLSPPVAAAVARLADRVSRELRAWL